MQIFRRICNGNIRHRSIILCHADKLYREIAVLPCKSAEIRIYKAASQLSCTVRTEVEEDHAVTFFNSSFCVQNSREHELICYIIGTAVLNCLDRTCIGFYTFAQNHSIICLFNTIFLFAGVLALSDAIQTTGAGDVVADWMIRLLGNTTNPYLIMLVFFLVPFILTQVMSNLATLTIFIPLVASACIRMGVDPRAAVIGVITASCVSIMTPMAAPCQIMIIEPGGYKLKDYLRCGTPLALILILVSVFFLPTLYPFT